jgi:proline iminopeptidase
MIVQHIKPIKKINQLFAIIFFSILHLGCSSQKNGTVVSSDSAPIYYRTYGTGSPLLIINGGPGMNSDGFENLAISLSKNNQTIIYDQRGTGKSVLKTLDSTTITMKLMMDDMESIRKELKIEKWSILGHSFGGMVASYYASLYPEHIDKLILSSSGGIDLGLLNYAGKTIISKLSATERDSVNYWTKKIDEGDTSHYARLQRGKNLAPAYILDKKFIPIIAERLTQGNGTINQLMWTDLQKINFDCASTLRTYKKPVLIIQGKQDIIKPETAERAYEVFSNSKIVYIDHSVHYGWLDNKDVFFTEVNSFLAAKD